MQNQLKTLQILRAIAATSVVYYHVKCLPNFGSFGVDIFFVISGFVMSLIVANGESTTRFAINRVARIVPLYWLLTSAVLVLTLFYPALFDSTTADFYNYLKSLFFIPYYKESGYLHPMLTMGWSLNYEMFFYACIWLSVIAFGRRFFFSTLFLLIVSYILLGNLVENRVMNSFFGDYMVFEFMAGMILH
ncbi:MAG: acyltransferase, partial [Betaproteobacteria bacterium]